MTVDPDADSVNQLSPRSWNRYTYTVSDPINNNDPSGLEPPALHPMWKGNIDDDRFNPVDAGSEGVSSCGSDWMTDASLQGPCCPGGGQSFAPGDPSPARFAQPPRRHHHHRRRSHGAFGHWWLRKTATMYQLTGARLHGKSTTN